MESQPRLCRKNKSKFSTQISIILIAFAIFPACIEHTLIPGQLEQHGQISRSSLPQHRDLLQGGLLKQKIASADLVDRVRFLAFYPLHLIAMGNYVEQGDLERSLPSFEHEERHFASKNKLVRQVKKMLISEDREKRALGVGLAEERDSLLSSLYNVDDYVRLAAVYKLRKYTFADIEPHLIKLLSDHNKFVRLETVRILQYFPQQKVLPYLIKGLSDNNAMVRGESVITMQVFGVVDDRLWSMLDLSLIHI